MAPGVARFLRRRLLDANKNGHATKLKVLGTATNSRGGGYQFYLKPFRD
jgi:hypothetical protein